MMMLLLPSPSKPRETSTRMLEICEMTIDWKSSPAQSAARLSQCSATQKLPASSAQSPDCSPSTVCGRRPCVGRAIGGAIERRGRRGSGGGGSDDADFRVVAAGRARERRWMAPRRDARPRKWPPLVAIEGGGARPMKRGAHDTSHYDDTRPRCECRRADRRLTTRADTSRRHDRDLLTPTTATSLRVRVPDLVERDHMTVTRSA